MIEIHPDVLNTLAYVLLLLLLVLGAGIINRIADAWMGHGRDDDDPHMGI